jgi:hypothetical protein
LAKAINPEPDGGYPNRNTAEGDFALPARRAMALAPMDALRCD